MIELILEELNIDLSSLSSSGSASDGSAVAAAVVKKGKSKSQVLSALDNMKVDAMTRVVTTDARYCPGGSKTPSKDSTDKLSWPELDAFLPNKGDYMGAYKTCNKVGGPNTYCSIVWGEYGYVDSSYPMVTARYERGYYSDGRASCPSQTMDFIDKWVPSGRTCQDGVRYYTSSSKCYYACDNG